MSQITLEKADKKRFDDVFLEFQHACITYKTFASAHEGYAVLMEEVEELWGEIKKKPQARNTQKLYKEATQVAAMAIRIMQDCCY